MRAGQGGRQLDQPEGGGGRLPAQGPAGQALRRRRRRHGVRRGRPGGHHRAQGHDLPARLQAADRAGGLRSDGHHLRPEHPGDRHRARGAQRLRRQLHRGDAPDQGDLPGRQDQRRRQQPVVLVPRQRHRPRGDALGVPVPRHPGGHGHGDRERRPAGGLRGHPEGAARARRGRDLQPPAGRDRAAGAVRRHRQGRREEAGGRPDLARGGRREAPEPRSRPRRRRLHRAGRRGGAAQVREAAPHHRRPADGRDEDRRRPVRRRQDVPAAGRQERAGDEEGGRLPAALHGGGEAAIGVAVGAGPHPHGHGQGGRPRHRQEHRRRRARLQQLRDHRSRGDGAGERRFSTPRSSSTWTSSG